MTAAVRDQDAAIRYEASRDVVTIQFGPAPEELHAGSVLNDVFAAFDATALGKPAVVRVATPFWGRDAAWLSALTELVTPRVLAAARDLVAAAHSATRVVSIDRWRELLLANQRAAYHRALCLRAQAEPPAPSSHSRDKSKGRRGQGEREEHREQ